jgi:uncharacterized glyoxalase superfamily protein PhnB
MTYDSMLKKNRSAPNTAVMPVLYYPEVREAVEWLTTALPFTVRLRNSDTRCQLMHGNGAIVVAKPGVHSDAAPSTQQSPAAHSITLRVTAVDELFGRAKAAGARVLAEPADPHVWRTPMLVPRPMGTSVDALGDDFRFRPSRLGRRTPCRMSVFVSTPCRGLSLSR